MRQGRSARNTTKKTIFEFLGNKKEVGFEKIAAYCREKHGLHRNTVKTYLDEMKKDGYLEQRPNGYHPYFMTENGKQQVKSVLSIEEWVDIGKQMPNEEREKEIQRLKKELKRTKRQLRIRELEDCPLPARAIVKKLLEQGFTIEDIYDKRERARARKESKRFDPTKSAFQMPKILTYVYGTADVEEELSQEIEIKLISAEQFHPPRDYGWWPVTYKPIKGFIIIAAYKELLELIEEEFEDQMLNYKEEFNLTDEDWKLVGPRVRKLLKEEAGRIDLPIMIDNFLWEYTNSKTQEGQAMMLKRFKEIFGEEAEKLARDTIQYYKQLRGET